MDNAQKEACEPQKMQCRVCALKCWVILLTFLTSLVQLIITCADKIHPSEFRATILLLNSLMARFGATYNATEVETSVPTSS